MKTILFSLLFICFSLTNLNAQNPSSSKFKNVQIENSICIIKLETTTKIPSEYLEQLAVYIQDNYEQVDLLDIHQVESTNLILKCKKEMTPSQIIELFKAVNFDIAINPNSLIY